MIQEILLSQLLLMDLNQSSFNTPRDAQESQRSTLRKEKRNQLSWLGKKLMLVLYLNLGTGVMLVEEIIFHGT